MTGNSSESSNGIDLAVAQEVGAEVKVDVCGEGDGDGDDVTDTEGLCVHRQLCAFLLFSLGLGMMGVNKEGKEVKGKKRKEGNENGNSEVTHDVGLDIRSAIGREITVTTSDLRE